MIDPVQAVLLFVIVLLTILLMVLGVQIFLILRELRGTIKRANRVLDHVDTFAATISQPLDLVSNIFSSSSIFSNIAKIISKYSREKDKN